MKEPWLETNNNIEVSAGADVRHVIFQVCAGPTLRGTTQKHTPWPQVTLGQLLLNGTADSPSRSSKAFACAFEKEVPPLLVTAPNELPKSLGQVLSWLEILFGQINPLVHFPLIDVEAPILAQVGLTASLCKSTGAPGLGPQAVLSRKGPIVASQGNLQP